MVVGQAGAVEHADHPALHGDQAGIDQAVQDAREGFRLDAQLRGDQALGHAQLDMAVAGLLLLAQVARHAAAGVAQGQGVDFVETLVQAHAEAAEQLQAGLGLLFQHAAIVRAVDADQAARLEGRSGHRVVAGAAEQQGFGKTLAGGDDLHQLFLAFRQHAGQGHLAFEQQVEAVRRIALMEQGGAGFQATVVGQAADLLEEGLRQPVEQMVLA